MQLKVTVDPGFRVMDYDAKVLKKAMRQSANDVRKEARKLISQRAVSHPGDFPGMQTGAMRQAIKTKVSRSGLTAFVTPVKTAKMPVYYPAFVVYGHRGPGSETAQSRRTHRKREGKKVALPRKNYIYEAALRRQKVFDARMSEALTEAIKEGIV